MGHEDLVVLCYMLELRMKVRRNSTYSLLTLYEGFELEVVAKLLLLSRSEARSSHRCTSCPSKSIIIRQSSSKRVLAIVPCFHIPVPNARFISFP